ncbi:MAG: DUF3581 domain-containing protein [Gammaproteobacteria bacterium]|nr:DUF3581 domain-containing protein [Gammaproteobacteria bacterium]
MFLSKYYLEPESGVRFTREQASEFAKQIAGDFNPLHDPDNKMFCVPGDLLFSVALTKLGLSQKMKFTFSGMVNDDTTLQFHSDGAESVEARDHEGKVYLSIQRSGETSVDEDAICSLARSYVEFSGRTFPHILVPLMQQENVMINPARPLVIYESMEIDLDHLAITQPELELTETSLEVNGKKSRARLGFCLKQDGEIVGSGTKYMALRGLRPYDQEAIDKIVHDYMQRREQ